MDTKINDIVGRSDCTKHKAIPGMACWNIHTSSGRVLLGICNKRARKAGFFGQITDKSLAKSFRSN